jgi:hypothetical protein
MPFVLKSGLSHADALLAQCELISCDIISVFIPENIAVAADSKYLAQLYKRLACSSEFVRVRACLKALPADDRGARFLEQFVGTTQTQLPFSFFAANKKVRIMQQWAASIGGIVEVER